MEKKKNTPEGIRRDHSDDMAFLNVYSKKLRNLPSENNQTSDVKIYFILCNGRGNQANLFPSKFHRAAYLGQLFYCFKYTCIF